MTTRSPKRLSPTPYISQLSQKLTITQPPRSPTKSPAAPKPVPRSLKERFVASVKDGDSNDLKHLLAEYDCVPFINTPEVLATGTDGWRIQSFRPCHYAARWGHEDCLRLLIKAGASINLTADYGLTPLMVSCEEGFVECVRVILESSSEHQAHTGIAQLEGVFHVDTGDVGGKSAFQLSCHHGHADCMNLLFSHGCSINSQDCNGRTSVHASSRRAENVEALRLLVSLSGLDLNRPDKWGQTALDLCPHNSVQESILLAAGAKPTADDVLVESLRHCAHLGDNARLAQMLSDFECRGVLNAPDPGFLEWRTRGYSALQYAAQGGNVEALELLLTYGADPEAARDEEGNAPFLVAAYWGHCDVLRALKRHPGVDVNVVNNHGQNAVHICVAAQQRECLAVLLQKDDRDPVDFNRADGDSNTTPLHLASKNSAETILTMLLQAGAQVNLRDNAGFTALGYAHTEGCRRLLRQVGGV